MTLWSMADEPSNRRKESPLSGRLTEVALGYQRVLEKNHSDPRALVGISLVALSSGQHEACLLMARAAVAAAPAMDVAWVTLGQALKAVGKCEEAKEAYLEAIQLNDASPLGTIGLGELLMAERHPEQACAAYESVVRRNPAMAVGHMGLGHALACLGRNAEALECYERALTFAPKSPEGEFAAGFVLVRLDRRKDAERRYRRALTLRPDFAPAWMNLGSLLREEGREAYAEAALRRAVELQPEMVVGWLNLALLKREQRVSDEAEAHLRRAFALDPEKIETLIGWCQFRAAEQDQAGAWEWLRWALAREPHNAEAVNMCGVLLHAEGHFADAIEAFDRAEALGSAAAVSNRGNSLLDLGRMDEALRAHETGVERDPHGAGAQYNLALMQLRLGDWERGWAGYEARWRFREVHRTPMVFRQPRWNGEPLQGRRILLHAEQGLGDAIQFCRYASLVADRGGEVILQVHEPVERLMHSLYVVREGRAMVAQLGMAPPEFDLECPLMSLPAVFGTEVDTVPWLGPYLDAEPELSAEQDAKLRAVDGGLLCVGLAWAGNPRYKADGRRSMKLATLLPLLRKEDVFWASLQKGEAAEQLKDLADEIVILDGSSRDKNLAETAALIAALDLVITTDTCIAHLAGAMGKPVWILLPHLADWRWMEKVETTPWYPTARLFRQESPGDWAEVLERVSVELGLFHSRWSESENSCLAETAAPRERAA
jgi:tetratricopeptide (TPR) repeat protein